MLGHAQLASPETVRVLELRYSLQKYEITLHIFWESEKNIKHTMSGWEKKLKSTKKLLSTCKNSENAFGTNIFNFSRSGTCYWNNNHIFDFNVL